MPLYEYSGFTPEIIWEYGQPIKVLKDGENYNLPESKEFLVLATEAQTKEMKSTLSDFNIQKIDEFDMNTQPGQHRERLYRNLFLISRK